MKLSTKGRYATRAMLDLALHYGEGAILLRDIAERQQLSVRYLEHVIMPLKMAGLVRSIRGAKGGFMLARPPSQIKLMEIIQLCEGSIAPVECVDDTAMCPRSEVCVTQGIWSEMEIAMRRVLESTSLQNLVERQRNKGDLGGHMRGLDGPVMGVMPSGAGEKGKGKGVRKWQKQ